MIQNKTTLYIAMSLDGFISEENDNLDFLNPYHVEGEEYGYKAFVDSDGGSQLANSLIQEGLIDEIIVSVAPIYLNKGTLLFKARKVHHDFELLSTKEFSSGLVQYH